MHPALDPHLGPVSFPCGGMCRRNKDERVFTLLYMQADTRRSQLGGSMTAGHKMATRDISLVCASSSLMTRYGKKWFDTLECCERQV